MMLIFKREQSIIAFIRKMIIDLKKQKLMHKEETDNLITKVESTLAGAVRLLTI